jgi:hypothetical protein
MGYHGMRQSDTADLIQKVFANARRAKVARIERGKLEQLKLHALLTPVNPEHLTFLKTRKHSAPNPAFLARVKQRIENARQRRLMRETNQK